MKACIISRITFNLILNFFPDDSTESYLVHFPCHRRAYSPYAELLYVMHNFLDYHYSSPLVFSSNGKLIYLIPL